MSDQKIKGGYILLARRIIESEIWQKPPMFIKVWIWLLSQAKYKDSSRLWALYALLAIYDRARLVEVLRDTVRRGGPGSSTGCRICR